MGPKNRKSERLIAPKNAARGWRIAFLVLCTVGLCLAADLARLHLNVHTDPDYQSYCAISERVNCDTVAASKFAVKWGLPTALWGMVIYLTLGALAVWGLRSRLRTPSWPFGFLAWVSTLAVAYSIYLFYVSHFIIESLCPVCVASYLVNVCLFGLAVRELRRLEVGSWQALKDEWRAALAAPSSVLLLGAAVAIGVGLLWFGVPRYWEVEVSSGPGGLTVGRTEDGHPWIGAREPQLEIVEFSDYRCPHCLRGHQEMRRLIASRPDEVRLIHRHYPLDQGCNPRMQRQLHPFACDYSRLAFCAGEQARFWEANDFLFAQGRRPRLVSATELAAELELDVDQLKACLVGDTANEAVDEDIRAGIGLGVRGTPTFVVDGRIYPGRLPEEVVAGALAEAPGTSP